jgi:hypothetical protein
MGASPATRPIAGYIHPVRNPAPGVPGTATVVVLIEAVVRTLLLVVLAAAGILVLLPATRSPHGCSVPPDADPG